jgi:hypothetical protein
LDKIESNDIPDSQASDEERVQRIIQEMNSGGADEQQEPPGRQEMPPQEERERQYQQQPQQQQYQGPPPGMMQQQRQPMGPDEMMGGQPMYYPPKGVPAQREQYNEPPEAPSAPEPPPKKNIWAHITDALKLPFVVAFVFFLLSLPVVDVYLAKYAQWAFSSGGHLSYGGLALKATVAGLIMGVYDTLDKFVSRLF